MSEGQAPEIPKTPEQPTVRGSSFQGSSGQVFYDLTASQRRTARELHDQKLKEEKAAHDLEEEAKDRSEKRKRSLIILWAMLVGLGFFLIVGLLLAIASDDPGNKELGRGILLTIISGVVGYAIGERRS